MLKVANHVLFISRVMSFSTQFLSDSYHDLSDSYERSMYLNDYLLKCAIAKGVASPIATRKTRLMS